MKLLALDTATEACSVALSVDGEIIERFELAPRRHTELILPMAESVLAEAGLGLRDIDLFAFGAGPGSFTGLRIAAGVVQGLALGLDRPVVPVCTLETLAEGALRRGMLKGVDIVLAAIDARMSEVYWAECRPDATGRMRKRAPARVEAAASVSVAGTGPVAGVGSGWASYADALGHASAGRVGVIDADALPRAVDMLELALSAWEQGQALPAEAAQPVYVRNHVADIPPTPDLSRLSGR